MNVYFYKTMTTFFQRAALPGICALLMVALVLTACDDDSLVSPDPPEDDLFTTYVALGNSITAGFQSDGINANTQNESYAVLLAEQMGTQFNVPALNPPGCPPPFVNPLTGERVGGEQAPECALRETPAPRRLNNFAVPGAAVIDVFNNLDAESNANALTTLILGGRTQIEAAASVNPTFASVWIGNNDVLGAALAGFVTAENVTPPETFGNRLGTILDELEDAGAQGGVLIGVANVTLIPHLSGGAAYWLADAEDALPPTFEVDDSCAPEQFGGIGEETLVPFGYGFGELLAAAQEGNPVTLDCAEDLRVLRSEEIGQLMGTVEAYNDIIEAEADARGWAFFNPNPTFVELAGEGLIPPFPNVQDPQQLFGPVFSLDGVHPSALAHELVTDNLVAVINEQYGTNLEPLGVTLD